MDDVPEKEEGLQAPARPGSPRRRTKVAKRHRLTRAERRAQIAEATLRIMARDGLQGTTVSRIAEEVGMEAPSLYEHYPNRHEMILAATESLFERVRKHVSLPDEPDMLERLRKIADTHPIGRDSGDFSEPGAGLETP